MGLRDLNGFQIKMLDIGQWYKIVGLRALIISNLEDMVQLYYCRAKSTTL